MLGLDSKKGRQAGVDTLIGPRVFIRGDVHFAGGLIVEGRIVGKVIAEEGTPAILTLTEQGSIEGEVHAPVVIINGKLMGDLHASESVELASQARVQGNVHYKLVQMSAGAMISGRLIHADLPVAALPAPESSPA
jgi:cytoskeletal protein CcmA (bactofilin family)